MEFVWIEDLVKTVYFWSIVETKEVRRSVVVAAEYTTDEEKFTHREGRSIITLSIFCDNLNGFVPHHTMLGTLVAVVDQFFRS